jgi:ornithine cyclodeaminase/alanine dehydrogenase-like protein (mu-crystallin family)
MLILSRRDVERLLDLDRLIDAVGEAMGELSAGRASMPPRVAAMVPAHEGLLAAMPAALPRAGALTTKLVTLFPRNAGTRLPTHQAVIVAFDPATGAPLALMDGTYVTAMRTAAGSALSARLLARPGASILAIVGTGVQARAHGLMLPRVRRIAQGRVAGRDPARVAALAEELAKETGIPFAAAPSIAAALSGADIACAATHSPQPVIRREWLAAGTHVTSVGLNPGGREVDAQTVADAVVVVESRAAALAPFPAGANDLEWSIRDGLISAGQVVEIGELVNGTRAGRTSDAQITLYKSVGVAVQDAAAAALVLEAARKAGAGVEVDV